MSFQVTPGWLPYHPNPSVPRSALPPGAVDAHCHVFGPGDEFPFAPERKYTPCDASKEQLFALRDHLGFDRNVIVQATCHGTDNRALVDALRSSNDRARGVATVDRDVTDAELRAMHDAGVRGTRFNFVKRLVDFTPREVLARDRQPYRAARLACRRLFRGGRSAGVVGFLHSLCRRRSSSITWVALTSANRSMGRSSSCSSG